jgi:enoyl-CoA hydratase/carnithine racemase
MTGTLLIDDCIPAVRIISLSRPERLNAFDPPTLQEFITAIRGCSAPSRDVRVMVILGIGTASCARTDPGRPSGSETDLGELLQRQEGQMREARELMEAAKQIVIASVQGRVIGGGLELALASDLIVAAEEAAFGYELSGQDPRFNVEDLGRLSRILGQRSSTDGLLSGRRVLGRDAERMGLVALAVPKGDLSQKTLELAAEIAQRDPSVLASMKSMLRRGLELSEQLETSLKSETLSKRGRLH